VEEASILELKKAEGLASFTISNSHFYNKAPCYSVTLLVIIQLSSPMKNEEAHHSI
jgi:hypothetical protein